MTLGGFPGGIYGGIGQLGAVRNGIKLPDWCLAGGISPSTVIGVYQPKGAVSYAASLINLASPGTGDAIANSPPAWASPTGWNIDVNTKYLTLPAVNCGAGAMIIRTVKSGNGGGMVLGWTNSQSGWAGYDFYIRPSYQWNNCRFKIGSEAESSAYTSTNTDVVHCASSAGAYINGVKTAYVPAGSKSWPVQVNCQAFATTFYCYAIALYSAALTDEQVAAVSAAMAAL